MDPPLIHVRALAFATLLCALLSLPTLADKLRITTIPPGASVQINGVLMGITPYEQNIPGGYLHKTKTSLGSRLGHPMIALLTLKGYAAKEIELTEGPMSWVSTLKGHNHGAYWLLKTDHFRVELQSASQTFTGAMESVSGSTRLVAGPRPAELSLEELVSRTKPAVVFFKKSHQKRHGIFYYRYRRHRHERPFGAR